MYDIYGIYSVNCINSFIDILLRDDHGFDTVKPEIRQEFPRLTDWEIKKILLAYFIENKGFKKMST